MGNCASVKTEINLDKAQQLAKLQQEDQFAFALNILNMSMHKKELGSYTNSQVKDQVAKLLESNQHLLLDKFQPEVKAAAAPVEAAKGEAKAAAEEAKAAVEEVPAQEEQEAKESEPQA